MLTDKYDGLSLTPGPAEWTGELTPRICPLASMCARRHVCAPTPQQIKSKMITVIIKTDRDWWGSTKISSMIQSLIMDKQHPVFIDKKEMSHGTIIVNREKKALVCSHLPCIIFEKLFVK